MNNFERDLEARDPHRPRLATGDRAASRISHPHHLPGSSGEARLGSPAWLSVLLFLPHHALWSKRSPSLPRQLPARMLEFSERESRLAWIGWTSSLAFGSRLSRMAMLAHLTSFSFGSIRTRSQKPMQCLLGSPREQSPFLQLLLSTRAARRATRRQRVILARSRACRPWPMSTRCARSRAP